MTPVQIAMQTGDARSWRARSSRWSTAASPNTARRDFVPEPANVAGSRRRGGPLGAAGAQAAAARRVGIVLFNFPPNGGAVGSAAYLAVFPSLFRLLQELKARGLRTSICRPMPRRCAG